MMDNKVLVVVACFLVVLSLGDPCFVGGGGFTTEQSATDWAHHYCDCFTQYKQCTTPDEVTALWDTAHTSGVVIEQDGRTLTFSEWNDEMITALTYVDAQRSVTTKCKMGGYSAESITIEQAFDLYLDIQNSFSTDVEVKKFKVKSSVYVEFDGNGKISKKVYTSDGKAVDKILTGLGKLKQAASGAFDIFFPESKFGDFLRSLDDGTVVFLGSIVLIMYLSLMFVIYKTASRCLALGFCRKSTPSPTKLYSGVNTFASDTEAEEQVSPIGAN